MIASNGQCLNRDELQHVLAGRISQADFDTAILHLDDCDQCRSAAESMESDGNWIVESLASDSPDPLHAETACQIALWRMLQSPMNLRSEGARLSAKIPCDQLGPYKLIEALGKGGMGTVYLAQHERLKRNCAIKILPPERVDQAGWLDRFDREMTSVAALEHPNVVRATDAGHRDGWHFLVMEYLDGLDVGRVAHRMPPLGVADACEIVRQAALGLEHIHQSGLVHRDIKPSNLMLTRGGTIKLLDLGLVLDGDDPLAIDDRLTTVGHLMGTMPYMAPEQLADSRDVTSAADIYSLGATLYRILSGHPPHQRRATLAAHIMAITNEDPAPLDSVREDIDRNVVGLVTQMLDRDPTKRPQSASEVATRLSGVSEGSRLKGLLREALRRPGHETSQSVYADVSIAGRPPKKTVWPWLCAAMLPLILVGAIVLRIQTDKGELVVHSEQDGLTILVKQGDKVVDQLEIQSGLNNRTTLQKGSYQIEIDGGGETLKLSESVVTIGRRQETVVNIDTIADIAKPTDAGPMFQGKTLGQWMSIMKRERDVRALAEAMNAVETLSRNSVDRRQAAEATIYLSRKLGGQLFGSAGFGPQSGKVQESPYFMARFSETIKSYFPAPAMELVTKELKSGTRQSKIACTLVLHNYLSGVLAESQFQSKEMHPASWCAKAWERQDDRELLSSLAKHLAAFGSSLDDDSFVPVIRAAEVQLADLTGQSIVDNEVLVRFVLQQVEQGQERVKAAEQTGMYGEPWLTSAVFRAAVAIGAKDPRGAAWDHLAAALLNRHYNEPRHASELKVIAKMSPKALLDAIDAKFAKCDVSDEAVASFLSKKKLVANSGFGGGGGFGDVYNPVSELLSPIWPIAIKHVVKQTEPSQDKIDWMNRLIKVLHAADFEAGEVEPNPIYAAIDEAVLLMELRLAKQEQANPEHDVP